MNQATPVIKNDPQPSQVPIAPGVRQDGPPADPADGLPVVPPAGEPVTVSSTSDARTINNVMRHEYKVLTEEEKIAMKTVKDMGLAFHEYVKELGTSRELSLAATKIEEAVMWSVKHITG